MTLICKKKTCRAFMPTTALYQMSQGILIFLIVAFLYNKLTLVGKTIYIIYLSKIKYIKYSCFVNYKGSYNYLLEMKMQRRCSKIDRHIWKCAKCRTEKSIRNNSFFLGSQYLLQDLYRLPRVQS